MKFKNICLLSVFFLNGCAGVFNDGRQEVNCSANYKSMTFGGNQNYSVHIDQMRTNHVGQKFVHVKQNLDIQFYGHWQSVDNFSNLQCH